MSAAEGRSSHGPTPVLTCDDASSTPPGRRRPPTPRGVGGRVPGDPWGPPASSVGRGSDVDELQDGGVGHAAALAHRLQAVAGAGVAHPVDHRRHQAGTGATEGVAQGDRAAVRVELVGVGADVTQEVHDLERRAERAGAAGAQKVKTVAVQGSPVEALLDVVRREDADLLVVGNRGLAGIKGRLLGSVPADATRRSACDVLVVHTTG